MTPRLQQVLPGPDLTSKLWTWASYALIPPIWFLAVLIALVLFLRMLVNLLGLSISTMQIDLYRVKNWMRGRPLPEEGCGECEACRLRVLMDLLRQRHAGGEEI